ncbi:MAG: hypothetical protein DRJ03_11485, partial [Chloroflexi bacterium]
MDPQITYNNNRGIDLERQLNEDAMAAAAAEVYLGEINQPEQDIPGQEGVQDNLPSFAQVAMQQGDEPGQDVVEPAPIVYEDPTENLTESSPEFVQPVELAEPVGSTESGQDPNAEFYDGTQNNPVSSVAQPPADEAPQLLARQSGGLAQFADEPQPASQTALGALALEQGAADARLNPHTGQFFRTHDIIVDFDKTRASYGLGAALRSVSESVGDSVDQGVSLIKQATVAYASLMTSGAELVVSSPKIAQELGRRFGKSVGVDSVMNVARALEDWQFPRDYEPGQLERAPALVSLDMRLAEAQEAVKAAASLDYLTAGFVFAAGGAVAQNFTEESALRDLQSGDPAEQARGNLKLDGLAQQRASKRLYYESKTEARPVTALVAEGRDKALFEDERDKIDSEMLTRVTGGSFLDFGMAGQAYKTLQAFDGLVEYLAGPAEGTGMAAERASKTSRVLAASGFNVLAGAGLTWTAGRFALTSALASNWTGYNAIAASIWGAVDGSSQVFLEEHLKELDSPYAAMGAHLLIGGLGLGMAEYGTERALKFAHTGLTASKYGKFLSLGAVADNLKVSMTAKLAVVGDNGNSLVALKSRYLLDSLTKNGNLSDESLKWASQQYSNLRRDTTLPDTMYMGSTAETAYIKDFNLRLRGEATEANPNGINWQRDRDALERQLRDPDQLVKFIKDITGQRAKLGAPGFEDTLHQAFPTSGETAFETFFRLPVPGHPDSDLYKDYVGSLSDMYTDKVYGDAANAFWGDYASVQFGQGRANPAHKVLEDREASRMWGDLKLAAARSVDPDVLPGRQVSDEATAWFKEFDKDEMDLEEYFINFIHPKAEGRVAVSMLGPPIPIADLQELGIGVNMPSMEGMQVNLNKYRRKPYKAPVGDVRPGSFVPGGLIGGQAAYATSVERLMKETNVGNFVNTMPEKDQVMLLAKLTNYTLGPDVSDVAVEFMDVPAMIKNSMERAPLAERTKLGQPTMRPKAPIPTEGMSKEATAQALSDNAKWTKQLEERVQELGFSPSDTDFALKDLAEKISTGQRDLKQINAKIGAVQDLAGANLLQRQKSAEGAARARFAERQIALDKEHASILDSDKYLAQLGGLIDSTVAQMEELTARAIADPRSVTAADRVATLALIAENKTYKKDLANLEIVQPDRKATWFEESDELTGQVNAAVLESRAKAKAAFETDTRADMTDLLASKGRVAEDLASNRTALDDVVNYERPDLATDVSTADMRTALLAAKVEADRLVGATQVSRGPYATDTVPGKRKGAQVKGEDAPKRTVVQQRVEEANNRFETKGINAGIDNWTRSAPASLRKDLTDLVDNYRSQAEFKHPDSPLEQAKYVEKELNALDVTSSGEGRVREDLLKKLFSNTSDRARAEAGFLKGDAAAIAVIEDAVYKASDPKLSALWARAKAEKEPVASRARVGVSTTKYTSEDLQGAMDNLEFADRPENVSWYDSLRNAKTQADSGMDTDLTRKHAQDLAALGMFEKDMVAKVTSKLGLKDVDTLEGLMSSTETRQLLQAYKWVSDDQKMLHGTQYEGMADKMYMAFTDRINGTNVLGETIAATKQSQRNQYYRALNEATVGPVKEDYVDYGGQSQAGSAVELEPSQVSTEFRSTTVSSASPKEKYDANARAFYSRRVAEVFEAGGSPDQTMASYGKVPLDMNPIQTELDGPGGFVRASREDGKYVYRGLTPGQVKSELAKRGLPISTDIKDSKTLVGLLARYDHANQHVHRLIKRLSGSTETRSMPVSGTQGETIFAKDAGAPVDYIMLRKAVLVELAVRQSIENGAADKSLVRALGLYEVDISNGDVS